MQVKVIWVANSTDEQVSEYGIYTDGALTAKTTTPEYTMDLAPGVHTVEVSAFNIWGEGPKSDPISLPAGVPSKPMGVSVTVTVSVIVNP